MTGVWNVAECYIKYVSLGYSRLIAIMNEGRNQMRRHAVRVVQGERK